MKTRKFIINILLGCLAAFVVRNFSIASLSGDSSHDMLVFIVTQVTIASCFLGLAIYFFMFLAGRFDNFFETHIEPKVAAIYKWFNRRNEAEEEPEEPEELEEIEPSDKIELPKTPPNPHPVDYNKILSEELKRLNAANYL